jgi:hypothetical protein
VAKQTYHKLLVQWSRQASERRVRLFLAACVRTVISQVPEEFRKIILPVLARVEAGDAPVPARGRMRVYHAVGRRQGDSRLSFLCLTLVDGLTRLLSPARVVSVVRVCLWFLSFPREETTIFAAQQGPRLREFFNADSAFCPASEKDFEDRLLPILEDVRGPSTPPLVVELIHPDASPSAARRVWTLATAIRARQSFQDMPVLHDVLLDAGCTSREALDHARGRQCSSCLGDGFVPFTEDIWHPGPIVCGRCGRMGYVPHVHVPGCWLLDLLDAHKPPSEQVLAGTERVP